MKFLSNSVVRELARIYYQYWWILLLLILVNIVILFYLNKFLARNKNFYPRNKNINLPKIYFNHVYLILALSVILLIYKIYSLPSGSYDSMESANLSYSGIIPDSLINLISHLVTSAHQPLYHVMLNLIGKFNRYNSDFFFRLPSIIFGVLSSLGVYCISYKIFKSRFISYVSFFLLNFHALFLWYSQRVETYTFFCFLSLVSYYFFWEIFFEGKEKRMFAYLFINVLGFLTHYAALFVIFSQGITIILASLHDTVKKNILFLKTLVIFNFVLIIWLPVLSLSFIHNPDVFHDRWGDSFYLDKKNLFFVLNNIFMQILNTPNLILGCFVFILIIYVVFELRKYNRGFYYIVIGILCSSVLYELSFIYSMIRIVGRLYFNVRHILWLVPFFIILYSFGLKRFLSIKKSVLSVFFSSILLVGFSIKTFSSNSIKYSPVSPDYKAALNYIDNNWAKGDFVGWPLSWCNSSIKIHSMGNTNYNNQDFGVINYLNLEEVSNQYKRIWVILPYEYILNVPHMDPDSLHNYKKLLMAQLHVKNSWHGRKIDVYLFTLNE